MPEMIDKNKLLNMSYIVDSTRPTYDNPLGDIEDVVNTNQIESLPVVNLVYCKDCEYNGRCNVQEVLEVSENSFCSKGILKRKNPNRCLDCINFNDYGDYHCK